MKKFLQLILSALTVVSLFSCTKAVQPESVVKISFGIDFSDLALTRTLEEENPDEAGSTENSPACLSIAELEATESGMLIAKFQLAKLINQDETETEELMDEFAMDVRSTEGLFVTVPLEMAPGKYRLKKFGIFKEDQLVYESVDNDHAFAGLITNILPVNFELKSDDFYRVKEIPVSVVCNHIVNSGEFGFGIFNFEFYTLYKVNYLVFDAFERVGGTLSIQKQEALDAELTDEKTAPDESEWSNVEAPITMTYSAETLSSLSFIDDLKSENEKERYQFTFTTTQQGEAEVKDKKLTLTLSQLLAHVTKMQQEGRFKYILVDVTEDLPTWEIR
ncbi:MAG: hypothetical protein RR202_04980 [Bacteroidales bacterium]